MPDNLIVPTEVLVWGAERIGDVVMTFPALKLIRASRPRDPLTYVSTDYAEDLVAASGLAEHQVSLRFKGTLGNFWKYRKLRQQVRSGSYGRIFVLSKTSKYERRIGPLKDTVWVDERLPGHQAERCARAVLASLGREGADIPEPRVDLPDRPKVLARLSSLGVDLRRERMMVVHPGCNRLGRKSGKGLPEKMWPPEQYLALLEQLGRRDPELSIVLVGTREERPLVAAEIEKKLPRRERLINLCGRTGVSELLEILKHAALLLSADSGVMHLGTVVGTPMIALFGPTDEHQTGPFGMGDKATLIRAVPRERAEGDPECMAKISVDQVLREVHRRLEDGVEARLRRASG